MTKSELIDELDNRLSEHKILKKDVEIIVETIFNCMTEAMARDDRVEIRHRFTPSPKGDGVKVLPQNFLSVRG